MLLQVVLETMDSGTNVANIKLKHFMAFLYLSFSVNL